MSQTLSTIDTSFWSCTSSYFCAFILAAIYVGSLYLWKAKEISTHPYTIKRRFISVFFVCLISPYFVQCFINKDLIQDISIWRILGIRTDGLLAALTLPLLLTVILFLGPLSVELFNGLFNIYTEPSYWISFMKDWLWIRNYIVAPVSEEFIFRACMLSLIIHCTQPINAIFICPIFFGAAHLHHMIEQIRLGVQWKVALVVSCFQFTYTSIFGAYCAYLYLRTGHVIAPIIVHSYCNHMGLPDFGALKDFPVNKRITSSCCFVIGLILWILLLEPFTRPQYFSNDLPWSTYV